MFGRRKQQNRPGVQPRTPVRLPTVPDADLGQAGDLHFLFDLIERASRAISIGQASGDRQVAVQASERSQEIMGCALLGMGMVTPEGMSQARDILYCLARMSVSVGNDERTSGEYLQTLMQMGGRLDDVGQAAMSAMGPVEGAVWRAWSDGRTQAVEAELGDFLLPSGDVNWGVSCLLTMERTIPLALGITAERDPRVWDVMKLVAGEAHQHSPDRSSPPVHADGRGQQPNLEPSLALTGHDSAAISIAWIGGELVATASSDDSVRVWDLADFGRCIAVLTGHIGSVFSVVGLPDGRVVSGGMDNTVRLWDLAEPEGERCIAVLEGHTDSVSDLALIPDGRLVSASHDGTLRVWQINHPGEETCERVLGADIGGGLWTVCALSNGLLASDGGDYKGTLLVWDPDRIGTESCIGQLQVQGADDSEVKVVRSLPGDLLVSSGPGNRPIRIWNVNGADDPCVASLDVDAACLALCALEDGRLLTETHRAPSAEDMMRMMDGEAPSEPAMPPELRLWDTSHLAAASDGNINHVLLNRGSTLDARAMCELPGDRVAVACDDGKVLVWQLPASAGGAVLPASRSKEAMTKALKGTRTTNEKPPSQTGRESTRPLPAWAELIVAARNLREGEIDEDYFTATVTNQEIAGTDHVIPLLWKLADAERALAQAACFSAGELAGLWNPRSLAIEAFPKLTATDDPEWLGHLLAQQLLDYVMTPSGDSTREEMMRMVGATEIRVPNSVEALLKSQSQLSDIALNRLGLAVQDLVDRVEANRVGPGPTADLVSGSSDEELIRQFSGAALGHLSFGAMVPPVAATGAEEPDGSWVHCWVVAARRDDGSIEPVSDFTWWAIGYYVITLDGTLRECDRIYWKLKGMASFADNTIVPPGSLPGGLVECMRARLALQA